MAEYTGPLLDAPAAPTTPTAKPKQKPYVPLQQVMPNAPPAASQAATVQPLNAQFPELVPSPPPAGLTPKARNEFIANEANRVAAERIKRSTENKKPLTETQSNATAFGMRMLESNQILNALEDKGVTDTGIFRSAVSGTVGLAPFIGEKLEEKTSDAISPAEFATEEKKYFPQVGDAPPVIKQKRDARELAIRAMNIQSGNNIPNINSSNNDPLGLRKK
jgi:hypothetical protein